MNSQLKQSNKIDGIVNIFLMAVNPKRLFPSETNLAGLCHPIIQW